MAAFTRVEEVQRNLVVQWEQAEKGVKGFYREGWAEDPYTTTSTVGLEEELVLMEEEEVLAAGEGTLVEAAEIINGTAVGEAEDLITPEEIGKKNAATKQLAMVRRPSHYCKLNRVLPK